MRAVLRRERRRRNLRASQSNPLPLPHHALVEHSDLLEPYTSTHEIRAVITGDRFLAEGFRHSPVPICLYSIFTDPDDALLALAQGDFNSVIVDMDKLTLPVITLLERLRALRMQRPEIHIALMMTDTDFAVLDFLRASCSVCIINKHLPLKEAWTKMQLSNPPPPREAIFSHKEWKILLLMAQGYSLRLIAQSQHQPYHRIIYRIGRILTRLGLQRRQQLIQLLQRINGSAGEEVRD